VTKSGEKIDRLNRYHASGTSNTAVVAKEQDEDFEHIRGYFTVNAL